MSVNAQTDALYAAIRANGQDPQVMIGLGLIENELQDRCRSTSNAYTPIKDLVFDSSDYSPPESLPTPSKESLPTPSRALFEQPTVAMPENGEGVWLTNSESFMEACETSLDKGRYGSLQVSVPAGDATYFVKLKAAPNGGAIVDAFGFTVRPGKTVTIDVPLCGYSNLDYRIYYAAGTTWYGYEHLFGPTGAYSRADDVFPFENGTGWEVELIFQPGGNLGAEGMDYDDFIG